MIDYSTETLQARWAELTAARESAEALLIPLWAELRQLDDGTAPLTLAEARAREPELRSQIRAIQEASYPLEEERANITRALGGKTS